MGIHWRMTESDRVPDVRMLDEFPNWIEDMTGTSRYVVAGCHVKPQRQAERIQANTSLSAGDVWFSDGTQRDALLKVAESFALGIIVYDHETWALERKIEGRHEYESFRLRVTRQWILSNVPSPRRFEDPIFPLRYSTRLICTANRVVIHGAIGKDGFDAPWDLAGE